MPKCEECNREFATQEGLEQHRKAKHVEAKKERKIKVPRTYIIVIAIIAAIILGIYFFASSPKYSPLTEDKDNFLGVEDAPVTIIEYSDFQCPFCGKFYQQTEPQLISEYVDTGKVKFIYKHFPLAQHQYAQKAAEASECAADQDKFWEYHNKLFENQNALVTPALKKYASDIGLDTAKFNACLDSGTMASRVRSDLEEGQRRGISSTPSFFVNGAKIEGAQPFSSFKQAIDSELSKT